MLQEIYTPVLKKVGILVLTTYSKNQDSWCNNVLTNLDCFRALENVGVINIEYQLGLVSFKGLEKAIGGLTDILLGLSGIMLIIRLSNRLKTENWNEIEGNTLHRRTAPCSF